MCTALLDTEPDGKPRLFEEVPKRRDTPVIGNRALPPLTPPIAHHFAGSRVRVPVTLFCRAAPTCAREMQHQRAKKKESLPHARCRSATACCIPRTYQVDISYPSDRWASRRRRSPQPSNIELSSVTCLGCGRAPPPAMVTAQFGARSSCPIMWRHFPLQIGLLDCPDT